jgi:chromosomal replication initiator protein
MFRALLAQSRAAVLIDEPFLLLPEIEFAYTAALRGAARLVERGKQPRAYDALGKLTCLVGGSGSGKSLVCRQAARELLRRHPQQKFALLSAVDWLPRLRRAQQHGQLAEFFDVAGQLALFGVEDLDRADADEALLALWSLCCDELTARGVNLLITLSQPPGRCRSFPPRLVSRLHGGLYAVLPPLETASRRKLVAFAAARHQLPLSDDVMQWLADLPPGSPRALCQAVGRLAAHPSASTLPAVQRLFSPRHQQRSSVQPNLSLIAHHVAEEFGVTAADLRSQSRQRSLRIARQCAMFLAHDLAKCPMEEIGRFFGRRTHTSVSHCCRKLHELLPGSPSLREQLARLRQRIVNSLEVDCA